MRLKSGSRVEVINRGGGLICWRPAEIISGNGHTYNVRLHDCSPGKVNAVKRVPRRDIRPSPSPMIGGENWETGDIVEVFDESAWKSAAVLKALGNSLYSVRLLGSPNELRIHKTQIRVRKFWQNGEWVLMPKGHGCSTQCRSKRLSSSKVRNASSFIPRGTGERHFARNASVEDAAELQESYIFTTGSLKRPSPFHSYPADTCSTTTPKLQGSEKKSKRPRLFPVALKEKVDAVAYPRDNLGETCMHSSFNNNRYNGYSDLEIAKVNGVGHWSLSRSSEFNNSDSDICSVGSCSVSGETPNSFSASPAPYLSRMVDSISSDAESFDNSAEEEENCSPPSKKEVMASIHELELHAYCCTLQAFYSSGHLSWDQEDLLTNLRIMLHISNDEHLMELRKLSSFRTCRS